MRWLDPAPGNLDSGTLVVVPWIVSTLALLAIAFPALAFDLSPDITVSLGGTTVNDEDIVEDDGVSFGLIPIGSLPAGADLVGYETAGSDVLLSLDITASLSPGSVTAEPRDVVRYDGATFTLEFDGSAEGVPAGASVDAIGLGAASELLLSFDITVDLPGAGTVSDEAVVSFDGASYSVLFDGSALGAAASALDTDGLVRLANGDLRLSFDGSGLVGGVNFDDEDALDYDVGGGTWSLAYDGSAQDANWSAADLVALPEPSVGAALLAALGLLGALARRR